MNIPYRYKTALCVDCVRSGGFIIVSVYIDK